jgi:hypothetical protein
MKRILTLAAIAALLVGTASRSNAVELLISGNFEPPGGATGEVPGWTLVETVTNSSELVDSASIDVGTDSTLFLKAFAGGGPLTPAQGNFDNDGLPAGDVDGRDFLTWQRGNSPNPLGAGDLSLWQANYGTSAAGKLVNARLLQTKPAVVGDTYTFQGSSKFEEFYSGLVPTLGDASPHGQIASPTTTQFKMEFLNSAGNVIGSPTVLDLRDEWMGNDPGVFLQHTPLVAVAPANTVNVRVVAEALNMAWNGSTTQETPGDFQSAFFNDFSLIRSGAAGDLLDNGNLNEGTPDALDFWNRVVNPSSGCCGIVTPTTPFGQILRTAGFADNAAVPGGTLGVWLSPFFGGWTNADGTPRTNNEGVQIGSATPVDGSISQTVGAVPGGVYNFSGWMRFEGNYSGGVDTISNNEPLNTAFEGQTSPTQSLITLEFLDNTGAVISSSVIDVKEERQALASCGGNANSSACGGPGANGWTQHTFTNVVAPAGTVQARLRADMIDGVYNDDPQQSAFWDDFSLDGPAPPLSALVSVPEPSSVVVLGLGMLLVGLGRNRK